MTQKEGLTGNRKAFSWLEEPVIEGEIIEERTVDILIIGAGHAGTAAARGAIEENAQMRIIVAEQQERENQWILGNGEVGHINSRWLRRHGFPEVDQEEFVNDWQLRTNNRSDYRLIRKYAENCGDCFDWLIEPLNEEEKETIYPLLKNPSEHMPELLNGIRAYPGTAKMPVSVQDSCIKKNQRLAEIKGVSFLFGTRALKLLTADGVVTGAILTRADGNLKIKVTKGVILAAGDYSRNEQMCRDLLTEAADMIDQETDWFGHGWTGDGLRMGMLAGGRMEPRSHAAMGGNYSLPGFEVIGSTAVLRVNKYGQRYSDEGFGTHILAALAGARQPDGMLYGVFDSKIRDQITYQTNCHAIFDYCDEGRVRRLEKHLEKAKLAGRQGYQITPIPGSERGESLRMLYSADSIEELAGCMYEEENNRQNFIQTVERYNELCDQKKDTDFGKAPALLHGLKKGPFYAVGQMKDSRRPIGQSYKILVTVSGLLIDENQQVLNDRYEPVKGLFATGNTSGCRFGAQYTTSVAGQSISIAQTLGREAGKHLAGKEVKSYE